jgi:hypothetical protein
MRLKEIIAEKQIENDYYHSSISSIKYPKRKSELLYEDRILFPKIYLNEGDFILAVRKDDAEKIYSTDISVNIFTKQNFVSGFAPRHIYIDFEEGKMYTDMPVVNSSKNLYVSKAYSVFDLFEEPFIFERDIYRLVVDEEEISLLIDNEEVITIKKQDESVCELFQNFVIYLYILYISEDSVDRADEKVYYLKSKEQLQIEGVR